MIIFCLGYTGFTCFSIGFMLGFTGFTRFSVMLLLAASGLACFPVSRRNRHLAAPKGPWVSHFGLCYRLHQHGMVCRNCDLLPDLALCFGGRREKANSSNHIILRMAWKLPVLKTDMPCLSGCGLSSSPPLPPIQC